MLKVILPLAALIAFTACKKDEGDTGSEEEASEEQDWAEGERMTLAAPPSPPDGDWPGTCSGL